MFTLATIKIPLGLGLLVLAGCAQQPSKDSTHDLRDETGSDASMKVIHVNQQLEGLIVPRDSNSIKLDFSLPNPIFGETEYLLIDQSCGCVGKLPKVIKLDAKNILKFALEPDVSFPQRPTSKTWWVDYTGKKSGQIARVTATAKLHPQSTMNIDGVTEGNVVRLDRDNPRVKLNTTQYYKPGEEPEGQLIFPGNLNPQCTLVREGTEKITKALSRQSKEFSVDFAASVVNFNVHGTELRVMYKDEGKPATFVIRLSDKLQSRPASLFFQNENEAQERVVTLHCDCDLEIRKVKFSEGLSVTAESINPSSPTSNSKLKLTVLLQPSENVSDAAIKILRKSVDVELTVDSELRKLTIPVFILAKPNPP